MNGTINTPIGEPPKNSVPNGSQPFSHGLASCGELFGRAFSFYARNRRVIVGILLFPLIGGVAQTLLGESAHLGLVLVLVVFNYVVYYLSELALFGLIAEEGLSVAGAYKRGLRIIIPFAWVSVIVALTTIGGIFLFVIPGILMSVWLSLSIYMLLAEGKKGISALTASWYYVRGYWMSVLGRFLFFGIALLFVSLIIVFITSGPAVLDAFLSEDAAEPEVPLWGELLILFFNVLLIIPFSIIYPYGIYRSLRDIKGPMPVGMDEQKLKRSVVTFLVVGIAGLVLVFVIAGSLLIKYLSAYL